jgi:hypothetical protein
MRTLAVAAACACLGAIPLRHPDPMGADGRDALE